MLRHSADPLLSTIGACCIWALVAWGIYGTVSDAISATYGKYLLFYLVVLVDRVYWPREEADFEMMSLHSERAY